MDIEKLKSIIRLANNNPSDNEANLAARKACKILAENDFAIFKPIRIAADKFRSASNPTSNSGTWADIKRSSEPQWRSKPYEAQGSPEAKFYQDDWFRKWNSYWKSAEEDPVKGGTYWDRETNPQYKPKSDVKYDAQGNRIKESELRKCSKCGLEVSTFRLKEEPFVCTICHWKTKI